MDGKTNQHASARSCLRALCAHGPRFHKHHRGYFITPYIQSKALSLPPVVLIFAIFTFTLLFGTLGIILAAPLTVIAIVALVTFYKPKLA